MRVVTAASGRLIDLLARQPRVAIGSIGLGGLMLIQLAAMVLLNRPI